MAARKKSSYKKKGLKARARQLGLFDRPTLKKRVKIPTGPPPDLDGTTDTAIRYVHHVREYPGGGHCPVCEKFVHVDKRRINRSQARALAWIAKQCEEVEWADMRERPDMEASELAGLLRQVSTLKHWKLIEQQPSDDPARKNTGMVRVTSDARAWLLGTLKVPEKAHIYNNECLGFSGKPWSVHDAMGETFDYEKHIHNE